MAEGWTFTLTGFVFDPPDAGAYFSPIFHAESEYVFDLESSEDDFLYTSLELTVAPAERVRFGLVARRTRAHETGHDVQRGPLLELSRDRLSPSRSVTNSEMHLVFSRAIGCFHSRSRADATKRFIVTRAFRDLRRLFVHAQLNDSQKASTVWIIGTQPSIPAV
jgi:hypothetical protein